MTNLTDDDGDVISPDDDELEVLPDDDIEVFDTVEGLDAERPIDDTELDVTGEIPPEDA
ncbi:hypothetical protein L1277_000937 [Okibacterium sp. HSC-33S16]|uniref:hypothetical protein n=1 Tax=Okibacterium sp. HSC-33S16 TaxID=2910965 RepID=UPI00209E4EC4|nr:hypothetical protein [Okibacterium sp. HSC-33S16]MCP2030873.1 hypothetical protein [Okibacterium sp. HSC-33S16]